MQFAGQRTDLDLNPIGDPVNLLIKLTDDTLPSPYAIQVTKITPQKTLEDGLPEAEFCKFIATEIFTPGTIATGYNSIRFDDEFMRFSLWRNFHDPYEWQWKDGRSRWDLLDVARLTRALRPEGINWPSDQDGKSTNRLELITRLNGIAHDSAHDALCDVNALIKVARLIYTKQPKLYDYLLKMRDKKQVQKLVNLQNPKPFVYASGRLATEHEKTSVFFPLAPTRNGNVLVYDLRYNLDALPEVKSVGANLPANEFSERRASPVKNTTITGKSEGRVANARESAHLWDPPEANQTNRGVFDDREQARGLKNSSAGRFTRSSTPFFPLVKELKYNRCPAVAPISVLDQQDGWQKIGLDKETVNKNLQTLLKNPTFAEQVRDHEEEKPEFPPAPDPESALYDGFLNDPDRIRCNAVRNAKPEALADFHPDFADPRLPDLFTHYKARNFPSTLSEHEQKQWESYRTQRLVSQAPTFIKELEDLAKTNQNPFLIEELHLWYQAIAP
jgi:exodeoxyribonuclease-1